jgi:biotin operon repressor
MPAEGCQYTGHKMVRTRGEDIRRFILGHVETHAGDIAKLTSEHFSITRQAVSKHLKKLTAEGCLVESGNTRNRTYKLSALTVWKKTYRIVPGLAEDVVWTNDIRPALNPLSKNAVDIWSYGFTEMFNNAMDHSNGTRIHVALQKNAISSGIAIFDDGVGIFRKIQAAMNLLDERQAILELAKGKLTTDPRNHSGEGIFFTSRMFDSFQILSGGVFFTHQHGEAEDWLLENKHAPRGTSVFMSLHNQTSRTSKKIFDQFSSGEDYVFNKTVVPVKLAFYGSDKLISRSQAKRVLARVELFRTVIFDFDDVPSIGQAFSDEIFRVFATRHPEMKLTSINANPEVSKMIVRARAGITQDTDGA